MRSIRASMTVLAAFAVLAASACSSSSGASGGSGSTACTPGAGCHDGCDPCMVLTSQQISDVVGVTVDSGTSMEPGTCVWQYTVNFQPELDIELDTGIDASTFQHLCAGSSNAEGYAIAPVSGVGDAACSWVPGASTSSLLYTELQFQKNCLGYTLSINASGSLASKFPSATILADEKTLAQAVVAKY